MIRKTPSGFRVVSKKGKNMSAPNLSKRQAVERLRQIEYFKRHSKGR